MSKTKWSRIFVESTMDRRPTQISSELKLSRCVVAILIFLNVADAARFAVQGPIVTVTLKDPHTRGGFTTNGNESWIPSTKNYAGCLLLWKPTSSFQRPIPCSNAWVEVVEARWMCKFSHLTTSVSIEA